MLSCFSEIHFGSNTLVLKVDQWGPPWVNDLGPVSWKLRHGGGCNQIDSLPCKATAANHITTHLESSTGSVRSHPDLSVLIATQFWGCIALKVHGVASICFADCNGGICNMTGLQMGSGWLANIWTQHRPSAFAHFARQYFKQPNDPEMRKITCIYLARPCFSFSLHFDSNYQQVFVHCNLLRTHPPSYETQTSLMWWRAGIRNHDDQ